jgi:hypothetical protein
LPLLCVAGKNCNFISSSAIYNSAIGSVSLVGTADGRSGCGREERVVNLTTTEEDAFRKTGASAWSSTGLFYRDCRREL